MKPIWIIDDDKSIRWVFEKALGRTDLEFKTLGTGKVTVNGDMRVIGDIHAIGNITADGSIQLGDTNTDNVVFNADIQSHLIILSLL